MAATMAGLLLAMVVATAPAVEVDSSRVVVLVATVVLVVIAFRAWAAAAAWSWVVAALALQGFGGLWRAVYSPTWQEHVAGVLVLVLAGVLIAAIARRTRGGGPQLVTRNFSRTQRTERKVTSHESSGDESMAS